MIKDKVITLIIAFVRDHGHDTGEDLKKAFKVFQVDLRETVSWHMKRDEYKADVLPTLKKIDSNLESALKDIPLSDSNFMIMMHHTVQSVIHFVHLYINLSR